MERAIKKYAGYLLTYTVHVMQANYQKMVVGWWWLIIIPLLQVVVAGSVLSHFIDQPNYWAFLYVGLLAWNFFSNSINDSIDTFVNGRLLLKKAQFPKTILVLSTLLINFLHLVIASTLFGSFLLFQRQQTVINLFALAGASLWLLWLTFFLCLLVASVQVRFRDVKLLTKSVLMVCFYGTPILFDLSFVKNWLVLLLYANPLVSIVTLLRQAFGIETSSVVFEIWILNVLITGILSVVSVKVYQYLRGNLVDWL